MIDAGTVLAGRYRLERRLGSGGMATVWLAHDSRLQREVAVKVLSDVLADDDDYRRRFEREARVAARLQHPGLVAVYDVGTESGRPYLVMELVPGDTLAERIAAGTAGDLDLVTLARELLDALAHIHGAGIVHRDVKPGNVLIGADGQARLTDFGIARPEDATELTRTGQVIGTFAYMAPELRRGAPATPRTDLYALGTLLRECDGDRHSALAPLIDRLRATEPGDRPESADGALAILAEPAAAPATVATEALPRTEPTAVLAGSPPRGPPAADRRHRLMPGLLLAALAALVAVAAIVVLGDGGDGSPPPSRQGGEATEQTTQREDDDAESPPPAETEEPSQASCASIEQEKQTLEEQKRAAEGEAGDDKAIKEQFGAEKKALDERAKECKP